MIKLRTRNMKYERREKSASPRNRPSNTNLRVSGLFVRKLQKAVVGKLKCNLQTSIFSFTWQLVKNAESQALA